MPAYFDRGLDFFSPPCELRLLLPELEAEARELLLLLLALDERLEACGLLLLLLDDLLDACGLPLLEEEEDFEEERDGMCLLLGGWHEGPGLRPARSPI